MAEARRTERGGTRPLRRAGRVAALALTVGALVAPTVAAAERPDGPATAPIGRVATPPGTQTPGTDPDFVDIPLPTNPISPAIADVRAESPELDAADDALVAAEGRRDGAVAERDRLRDHIADLVTERAETVDELARRQADEEQRGRERALAVAFHADRIEDLDRAQVVVDEAMAAVERARDALRDLIIANYMSEATTITDIGTVLGGQGDLNDSLVRLSLGESSLARRAADIEDRLADQADAEADRDAAAAARDRALAARQEAEGAERDAVAAREGTERHIVDVDAESEATKADEAAAVVEVDRREGDVLTALVEVTPARLRADAVGDGLDFQLVALDAWVKAAAGAPCRVEWWMLAGISKIEGNHGTYGGGRLGARGYPSTRIIGPPLDGTNGNARIGDTDGGLYDDDPVLDRAVGPMQFIPSTWAVWGRDGDGDGQRDPHTFYDATAGAAAYLCAGRTDLTDEAQLRAAYLSYNRSLVYVSKVLAAARGYQAALQLPPVPPTTPPPAP